MSNNVVAKYNGYSDTYTVNTVNMQYSLKLSGHLCSAPHFPSVNVVVSHNVTECDCGFKQFQTSVHEMLVSVTGKDLRPSQYVMALGFDSAAHIDDYQIHINRCICRIHTSIKRKKNLVYPI